MSSKPIAMAYVAWQNWEALYEPKKALMTGTIFRELDLPFTGDAVSSIQENKGGCRNGRI